MTELTTDAFFVRKEGHAFDVAGAHLVWKARAEETGGAFAIFEQTLAPGEGVPAHRHGYTEVFYILAGRLSFQTDAGRLASASAGETVIARPEALHGFRNEGPEVVRLLSIAPPAHQRFFDAVEASDREALRCHGADGCHGARG